MNIYIYIYPSLDTFCLKINQSYLLKQLTVIWYGGASCVQASVVSGQGQNIIHIKMQTNAL